MRRGEDRAIAGMEDGARYVEGSDRDRRSVASCPGVVGPCRHGAGEVPSRAWCLRRGTPLGRNESAEAGVATVPRPQYDAGQAETGTRRVCAPNSRGLLGSRLNSIQPIVEHDMIATAFVILKPPAASGHDGRFETNEWQIRDIEEGAFKTRFGDIEIVASTSRLGFDHYDDPIWT